jgi:Spy/CpxP family protein refolding chaperone
MNMNLLKTTSIAAMMLGGLLACTSAATIRNASTSPAAGAARAQLRNRMEKLAQELNLTPDQKQQLKPVLQEQAQKLRALRANKSLTQAQKGQQLVAIRQDLVARIKTILTPDQLAKWQ